MAVRCLSSFLVIDVFVTGYLLAFYSFQDGETLYFYVILTPSCFPGQFSYISPRFSLMVQSAECFFAWWFCCRAIKHFGRKIPTAKLIKSSNFLKIIFVNFHLSVIFQNDNILFFIKVEKILLHIIFSPFFSKHDLLFLPKPI